MLLLSSVILSAGGLSVATLWSHLSLFQMSLMLLYHLLAVHSLWYAPFYGWLLLVSAWARRAPFLWAVLPPLAIGVGEKIAFNTSHFGTFLLHRLGGGTEAMTAPGTMPMDPTTHLTPGHIPGQPGSVARPGLHRAMPRCGSAATPVSRSNLRSNLIGCPLDLVLKRHSGGQSYESGTGTEDSAGSDRAILCGWYISTVTSMLHPKQSDFPDQMMLSIYVTLGIFLLLAVRNPSAHRSLIAFTGWSSLAHASGDGGAVHPDRKRTLRTPGARRGWNNLCHSDRPDAGKADAGKAVGRAAINSRCVAL